MVSVAVVAYLCLTVPKLRVHGQATGLVLHRLLMKTNPESARLSALLRAWNCSEQIWRKTQT